MAEASWISVKERLTSNESTISKIHRLIYSHFRDVNKMWAFLNGKNELLGNQIPMDMMKQGREEKLLKFIENSLKGNNP